MIRKSLSLLMLGLVAAVGSEAQTPVPPPPTGEPLAFSMFFDGDSSYLGIITEEVTKGNFAKYGLREVRGVAVQKVVEGSPAEKAGVQTGDVVVRFNNEEVTSVRKLTRLLAETAPDHQAKLTIIRGGSESEIVATLGKRPMPKFEEGSFGFRFPRSGPFPTPPSGGFPTPAMPDGFPRLEGFPPGSPDQPFVFRTFSGRRIGVGVTELTKQLSEHFGVTGGVMINEVRTGSPAAKAGLKAGDIIIEADGKEVKTDEDLIRAIAEKKEGDVTLTILRDRNRQTVRVTPEEVKDTSKAFFVSAMPPVETGRSRGFWPKPLRFPKLFPNGLFPRLH